MALILSAFIGTVIVLGIVGIVLGVLFMGACLFSDWLWERWDG